LREITDDHLGAGGPERVGTVVIVVHQGPDGQVAFASSSTTVRPTPPTPPPAPVIRMESFTTRNRRQSSRSTA
jgi:hypothetical protein